MAWSSSASRTTFTVKREQDFGFMASPAALKERWKDLAMQQLSALMLQN